MNTELYRAVEDRIELKVQTLLTRGGDPNYSGPGGRTPLHCAVCDRPKLEIVNQLLAHRNIQLNNVDDNGCTALHFAAEGGYTEIVKRLVEEGATVDVKNKEGKSPKKKALENGKREVALFFAERSARRREGLVPFSHPQTNNLLNGDMQRLRCFGGWDGVSVSKHYEDILREAREKDDVALQISSLKKCGDTFFKGAEHRLSGVADLFLEGQENLRETVQEDYKKAIYAYNEAITLCEKLPKELQERKREPKNLTPKGLLLQRLEELEASYIQKVLRRKPLSEGVKIEVRRERLAQMRIEAEKKLNRGTKAQVILREITDKNRSLVQDLIKDCLAILGQPSFSYAIMSCGSMSREEMCLYSDVELVVLLRENTPEHRKYFVRFMNLFWFKIMMVGEDGEIQGFRLDENNATIYQEFLSTPKEMAERMLLSKANREQGKREVNVISDFLGVHAWVDGDQELISAYEQEVTHRLDQLEGGRKLRELRALQQLQNNLNDFKPKLGNERDTNPLFDVKKELYRLPSQIANKLCLYYNIKEKNTWKRLEELKNAGYLSGASCENLCKLIEKIARLRLRVHAHYKTEKEEIWHPGLGQPEEGTSKNLFELTLQDIEILEQIYEVLIPLHKAVETFCRERGNTNILKGHFLPDMTFVEQAEMHESQLEYDNARVCYEQALSLKPADSRILSKLGHVLYRLGRYQEARQRYESALNIEREKQIEHHPVVADILHNLGRIWNALGQEKKAATEYYEPALTMMSDCYNENHSSLVDILIDLGKAKRALGREEEAVAHHKHVLHIYQAAHHIPLSNFDTEDFHSLMKQVKLIAKFIESENPSDAPVTLNNLGSLLRSLDRGGKHCFDHRYRYVVKSLHKKALDIYQSENENKEFQDPRIAETLEQMAEALCDFEECENALNCYEKVLEIYKKFYGENHSEAARILNRQGEVFGRLFRNKATIKSHESALCIYEAHSDYGRNHPCVAAILNNLGKAYYALGEYKKAIQNYYDLALDIYKEHYNEAPLAVAETLNHLGLAKGTLGEYNKAEGHYNRALEIYKTHYGESHPLVAKTHNHLGKIFSEYGKINTAREHHKEALKIYRKFNGKSSSCVGETLNYFGEIWRECGNLEKARESHRQALVIYKGWFGEQHPHVAETLHCLGMVWGASGEYKKANEYYKAACNIRMKRYGSEHPLVAETLCQLGNSWRALGKSVNARYYYNANGDYEKALEIRKARYGEGHFLVGEVLSGLGNSWYALWKSEKAKVCKENAEKSCRKALTIYDRSTHYGKVHLWVGELYNQLGKISFERKDYRNAKEFCAKALEIYKSHPGYGRSHFLEVADVLNNLGLVWSALDEKKKAMEECFIPALYLGLPKLNLRGKQIGDEGAKAIAQAIEKTPQIPLQQLDLSGNCICAEGAKAIAQAIEKTPQIPLQQLDLGCNRIGDEGAKAIAQAIEKTPQIPLQQLDLSGNYIGAEGAKAIAQAIENTPQIPLQRLDLGRSTLNSNQIGAAGAKAIAQALEKTPQILLQQLDLGGNKIGADGAKAIAQALEKTRQILLQQLDLEGNKIGADGAKAIAQVIEKTPQIPLQRLNLSSNQIGDDGAKAIAQAIEKTPQIPLQRLNLKANRIGDEGAKAIVQAIEKTPQIPLQRLDLRGNKIGDDGAKAIAQAIEKTPQIPLQQLYLGDNQIGGDGAKAIAQAIEKTPRIPLQRLDLEYNQIGDAGAKAIVQAIEKSPQIPLQQLDLGGNKIGAEGAKAIAQAIEKTPRIPLQRLDLEYNQIGDAGAKAIAQVIEKTPQIPLQRLNLSSNQIGDDGAKAIAQAIEKTPRIPLQRLDLEYNQIGDAGAKAIAQAIEKTPQIPLQRLDLEYNQIGDAGAKAIAQVIEKTPQIPLQRLNLSSNQIGDDGAKAIAQAIEKTPRIPLQRLDLEYNQIGDAGAKAIAQAIEKTPQIPLQWLILCRNQIGDEGASALKQAKAKSRTLTDLWL